MWLWLGINVLLGAVPALVGLAFVLWHPGRGRWRTWGLVGFGLGLASAIGQLATNAMLISSGGSDTGSAVSMLLRGPLSMAAPLMSLIASGFVVAAVVTDRGGVPVSRAAGEEPPSADAVVVDDPLAYDPADFEPPRLTS